MRIAMVVAGAGSMYCGACARDTDLARALFAAGHDVCIFPIYTPIRLEEDLGIPQEPLRIGGINAFLREKYPSWAQLPPMVGRWLDNPGLITWASQFSIRTQAADLGRLSVSFLKGANGPHGKAIEELAERVADCEPDVVMLANSLLAGLIEPLTFATAAPIVCQVQGEDGFLDELPEPWKTTAFDLLLEKVQDASHFIAPCRTHAEAMAARLKQPFERFSIVPPSVKSPTEPQNGENRGAVRFGHLSSIRWVKGLDLLVTGLSNSRGLDYHLTVRGKVLEPEFFRRVVGQAEAAGIDMHFGGEATPVEKADFFTQCDFLVLPSRLKESRGIAALEALAAGTPVIAPDRGIFSELAEATGGVALYNRDFELAEVLEQCAKNRNEWHARGIAAASAVSQQYPPRISAAAAIDCFTSLVERRD